MKITALFTITILAGAASAQPTMNFSANGTQFNIGQSVSWTVSVSFDVADFPDPTAYVGGFVGSFIASNQSLGTAAAVSNLFGGQAIETTVSGADINNINIFNAAILATDDPSNPIDIMTFDVIAGATGVLNYDASGVLFIYPDDDISTSPQDFQLRPPPFNVTSDSVTFVPAPGAFILLG